MFFIGLMNDLEEWQVRRTTLVTGRAGNLALVGYQPVKGTDWAQVADLPIDVSLGGGAMPSAPSSSTDVMVRPGHDAAESAIAIDGKPISGPTCLDVLRQDGSPLLTFGRYTVDAVTLDGTDVELRIYDAQAPTLRRFERIDCYPENPGLRVEGTFVRLENPEQVAWDFTRHTDSGHTKMVPGTVHVTIAGSAYDLVAFLNGRQLMLVFADATNGRESYGAGRFLAVPAPDADDHVVLDFNYACIPPCGFSDSYSCPLPPAANRIGAPIRAGERAIVCRE